MRIPNWYRIERHGLAYYEAWNLRASGIVRHGFSTRKGGESPAPYDTLNLSLTVNDDPQNVLANRRLFASAIGVDPRRIVVADQVHSNSVRQVGERDAGSGALDHSGAISQTDVLITNVPGLPLALHFADCVCIFLLDPVNRAIGAVHAGWRGTAGAAAKAAVQAMGRAFGTDPGRLLAAVAPSIERHCYEVGRDAAEQFHRAFPADERVLSPSSEGRWLLDLKTANLLLLSNAGVAEANIAVSDQCTSCDRDEFFSYRRDGITGRMGGWIALA